LFRRWLNQNVDWLAVTIRKWLFQLNDFAFGYAFVGHGMCDSSGNIQGNSSGILSITNG
jgi:hypothetical protein